MGIYGAALTLTTVPASPLLAQYSCTILFSAQSLPSSNLQSQPGSGWYMDNAYNSNSQVYTPYAVSPTGSVQNIMPPGFTSMQVTGLSGNVAVGDGIANGQTSAEPVMWNFVSGAATILSQQYSGGWSAVYATDGTYQVGQLHDDGNEPYSDPFTYAAVWSSSTTYLQTLSGGGLGVATTATAVSGNSAVGYSYPDPDGFAGDFPDHALYWPNLDNPNSVVTLSYNGIANGLSGNQVVGNSSPESGPPHAMLWSTTTLLAIDLNPMGIKASGAFGTNGMQQIGYGDDDAFVWSGTAASAINLNEFLPVQGTWNFAGATSIDQNGNIFGTAYGTYDGYNGEFAVEWSPVPEPREAAGLVAGLMVLGQSRKRDASHRR